MPIEQEDFLEHFGVKGMKWGVHNVNRHAKRDAAEFARAKLYYGEGAGVRRRLIKQTVESKSARMPGYAEAFQKHLDNQDMSKHSSKAVSERNRTDRKVRNKQRTGALARRITGERGTQAAMVAVVAGGAAYLNSDNGRRTMSKVVSKMSDAKAQQTAKRGSKLVADYLRKQGLI